MSSIYDSLKRAEKRRKSSQAEAPTQSVALNEDVVVPNVFQKTKHAETRSSDEINSLHAEELQSNHEHDEKQQIDSDQRVQLQMRDVSVIEQSVTDALKRKSIVSDSDLSKVSRMHEESHGTSLVSLIVRMGLASDSDIASVYAEVLDVPMVSRDSFPKVNIAAELMSERFLKEQKVMPLAIDDDYITVAMCDPLDIETQEAIEMACDREINLRIGIASEIEAGIDQICGDRSSQMDQILDDVAVEEISDEEVDHLKDLASEAPVIRLVNLLIQRAIEQHASDIHIEPFEGQLKVRYRIDGVLKEVESPAKQFAAAIISRIKIMAKLDIAERRLPQDGRVRTRMQGVEFDMRISTIPTMHGESVVIRLLNQESVVLDFESLGFDLEVRNQLEEALRMPHGMILITGPTGSGKTTTLYTALNLLNEPNRKIITVEDPIEYQLEGINQIQAKSSIGLTFASALRSIVRQDPDVIMVGEMRDLETAEICVKSALTGHLVLSTLHTNDAASSITRLIGMRVEDYLLTSTLNAVLAQRLVRVLCEHCKEEVNAPQKFIQDCHDNNISIQQDEKIYIAKGCSKCGGTGYVGRTCIVELLILNDEMKKKILAKADAADLQRSAVAAGMKTMHQDGLSKVLQGVTTIEEVTRITKE